MKHRLFFTGLAAMLLWAGTAMAQGHEQPHGTAQPQQEHSAMFADGGACPSQMAAAALCHQRGAKAISSTQFVLLPAAHGNAERMVVINSVDNCIDVMTREDSGYVRTGRHLVDIAAGRHDVNKILHPQSLEVVGNHIIYVAEATADTGKIGILAMGCDTLTVVDEIFFPHHAGATELEHNAQGDVELYVTGVTMSGYSINSYRLAFENDVLQLIPLASHVYNVPKQAERIKQSDPHGLGLTVVAVVVVFAALICIAIIIGLFGKTIQKSQDKRAKSDAESKGQPIETVVPSKDISGDVYAAIVAAIYLYEEELHDEEDTVLTISKVERAWTPWNAKFYSMNQYFNNRR